MADTIGFLSVRQHADHGYLGGFLIVNLLARPLEFHCTMPVKPSRAQELLYGPTLADFVCGEQIAKALTSKAKLKPKIVFTDTAATLSLGLVSNSHIVFVEVDSEHSQSAKDLTTPHTQATLETRTLGEYTSRVRTDASIPPAVAEEVVASLGSSFELTEPFQRITHALLEAHPIAKAA